MCCASTTICVKAARDSKITMNALNIRRSYQRNMQLYMIVKEKGMIDRQIERVINGASPSTSGDSQSQTITEHDGDETSSFSLGSHEQSCSDR